VTYNTGRRDGEPRYPRWSQQQKTGAPAVYLSEQTGGRGCGQHARWRAPLIAAHRLRVTRACMKESEGGDGSKAQRQRRSGSGLAWRRHGGVCPYAIRMGELDRGDKAATQCVQACQRMLPRCA
jgi:hypothetical protein